MGFQTEVKRDLLGGKQNMHLIGYMADSIGCSVYIKSSQITDGNGAIDRREVMRLLLSKHPANTEILLHAVSNIGLQDTDSE